MTTITAKEVVVSWDGEANTWPDYARKVRLQFEKTAAHKRRQLGPELASRLTGRAWAVTPSLDHKLLNKRNGAKYLLRFLRDRLCRTAIPDAGARLEDLLIRLRRPLGMSMAQWSNEVLETYRKVQRALVRARHQLQIRHGGAGHGGPQHGSLTSSPKKTSSEPAAEPPSPMRRGTPTSATSARRQGLHGEEEEGAGEDLRQDEGGYARLPQEDPDNREPDGGGEWYEPYYTEEEWREWRKQRRWRDDDESSSGEDLPWDELEVEDIQVLPDEVLGWLLLRRANLSAANRLAVQSSVQNSLFFKDIENALRDQEEELMLGDSQRHNHPRRRTYWVEEEGNWGLLATPEDGLEELNCEVHWVGSQLPAEVYDPGDANYEDDEIYWSLEQDGWHGYAMDQSGFWLETDGYGAYWTMEDDPWEGLSPEQNKELEEAYAVYEGKAKTFMQSRQFQKAKGASRGFYPLRMMKGKGKGKSSKGKKGKGKGSFSTSSTASTTRPLFAAQGQHGGDDVMSVAPNQGGCFICGDRAHGWRNCPKRSDNPATSSSGGKGPRKGMFWVESLTPSNLSSIYLMDELDDQEVDDEDTKTIAEVYMMSGGPDDVVQDTSGFGVLDIGATETVTSLEALEKLIHLRGQHQGEVQDIRVVAGGRKPFRFGNGEARTSESFILLKQHLGKKTVLLGMYTLNVEKAPILIGIKTLTKLGAIIDVKGQFMVLTSVNAEVKIPLKKSVSGHLLVDLTRNWLEECQPLSQRPQPSASGVYMVAAAEDGRSVEEAEVLRSTVNFEVMSLSSLGQLLQSSEPHMDVMMTSNDESLQVEEDGGRVLEESLVLTVNDGRVCNLAQTDQRMRDQVIDALARGHRSPSRSHGAQEEDVGETTEGGDLRLQSDHRSADLGPEVQWTSVPWSTRGGGHGTRLSLGSEQVCRVDGMSSLPSTVNLHTRFWVSRVEQEGRPFGDRRRGPDQDPQSSEGQRVVEGQDCGARGGRTFTSTTARGDPSTEEELSGGSGPQEPIQGQRPPGIPRSPDLEGSYSPSFREERDGRDSRSQSTAPGRDSRTSGVSEQSSGHQRRGGRSMVKSEFSLKTVKEEISDGSQGPLGPHDIACTTSPQLTSGEDETENLETGHIENDLAYYEQEEHFKHHFEYDPVEKYVKVMEEKSKVVFDSEDYQDDGLAFNAFDVGEQDARRLDPMDGAYILQVAEDHLQEIEDIFLELGLQRKDRPHSVMELCCEEDSGVTKAVERSGGRGVRVGLFNGCDLLRRSGFNKAMSLLEEEQPDVMWVSMPCGPTSMIQELNKLTPESAAKIEKKVAKSKKLAGKAVILMEKQLALGGEVLQEWPKGNRAWEFASIRNFWNRRHREGRYYEARVDGCMYGLSVDGQLMKKPWIIKGTHRSVWQLHNTCSGDHVHTPCEGGTRTRMSALYPPAMCKRIAYVVKQTHAHPGREEEEAQAFPVVLGQGDPDFDPEALKTETDQTVMKWATDLLRLHKKLGHPSRQAFVKMLKDRGADKKLVTIATQLHCQDCEEAYVPPSRRVTTLEDATKLWEVVQMDNMEFTVGDMTYHFQIMIDEASNYAVGTFLFKHSVMESRNATTEQVTEAVMRSWVQYFGYPQKLKIDKEGAHRGRELEQWALTRGVEIEAIPAEAHGQIGQVERLIGTLKEKVLRFLRSSDEDPAVALASMVAAHNMMNNVGGYSPMQWVFVRIRQVAW